MYDFSEILEEIIKICENRDDYTDHNCAIEAILDITMNELDWIKDREKYNEFMEHKINRGFR